MTADQKKSKSHEEDKSLQMDQIPLEELELKLSTSSDGLSRSEAQKRLEDYGYNELKEKETSPYLKFLSYFWGPIPWMIELAAFGACSS